jgi:MraZ protein
MLGLNRDIEGCLGEIRNGLGRDSEMDGILQDDLFFLGEFDYSLDSQCRFSIPSEWRHREGVTRLILFPGRDNDLLLFPFETFREFIIKARRLALANRGAQEALARIGSRARDCRCDKQGRIKVERSLLEAIGITKQIKLIGAVSHIKLCAPEAWQQQNLDNDVYLDELQKISETSDDLTQILLNTLGKK